MHWINSIYTLLGLLDSQIPYYKGRIICIKLSDNSYLSDFSKIIFYLHLHTIESFKIAVQKNILRCQKSEFTWITKAVHILNWNSDWSWNYWHHFHLHVRSAAHYLTTKWLHPSTSSKLIGGLASPSHLGHTRSLNRLHINVRTALVPIILRASRP